MIFGKKGRLTALASLTLAFCVVFAPASMAKVSMQNAKAQSKVKLAAIESGPSVSIIGGKSVTKNYVPGKGTSFSLSINDDEGLTSIAMAAADGTDETFTLAHRPLKAGQKGMKALVKFDKVGEYTLTVVGKSGTTVKTFVVED